MPYVVKSQFNDEGRRPAGIAFLSADILPPEYGI